MRVVMCCVGSVLLCSMGPFGGCTLYGLGVGGDCVGTGDLAMGVAVGVGTVEGMGVRVGVFVGGASIVGIA